MLSSQIGKGIFSAKPGPLMAEPGGIFVTVKGSGGHGSMPHSTLDPIPVACEMVTALQTMVTRRFSAFEPVVLTVGEIHAGASRNIIRDEASFSATTRAFDSRTSERLGEYATELCRQLAAAHGLKAEVRFQREYPVLINDAVEYEFLERTVTEVFTQDCFESPTNPTKIAEDFSRALNEVPGAFVFLGACPSSEPALAAPNHSSRAVFDDRVVADGAALLAELAVRRGNRRCRRVSSSRS